MTTLTLADTAAFNPDRAIDSWLFVIFLLSQVFVFCFVQNGRIIANFIFWKDDQVAKTAIKHAIFRTIILSFYVVIGMVMILLFVIYFSTVSLTYT